MSDFELRSASIAVVIDSTGAQLKSVLTPDRNGAMAEITRGGIKYAGSTCGRFANRIADGRFCIDGVDYLVSRNEGTNHLHGGVNGFDTKEWQAKTYRDGDINGVELTHISPDGDEGYPGEVTALVRYWVNDDDVLGIDFAASTNAPTPVNLTNHTYWNLGSTDSQSLSHHSLQLGADHYVAVDDNQIPTGDLPAVDGSLFDLTAGRALTESYDHCFVLDRDLDLGAAAVLSNANSGRVMSLQTDQPGLQVYTADHVGRFGVALEAQDFPDAPNQPHFPGTILRPGEDYSRKIRITFSTDS